MTVFVDDMKAPLGRMKMCHMIADSREELLHMAQCIGMDARWLQFPGSHKEHFDINQTMKQRAIRHGAVAISRKQLAAMIYARRKARRSDNTAPTDR